MPPFIGLHKQRSSVPLILGVFSLCVFVTTLTTLTIEVSPSSGLSCVDEDGKELDWFIAYKFPELRDSPDSRLKTGYAYSYLTSKGAASKQPNLSRLRGQRRLFQKDNFIPHYLLNLISGPWSKRIRGVFMDRRNSTISKRQADIDHGVEPEIRKRAPEKRQGKRNDEQTHWTLSDKLITDHQSLVLGSIKPAFTGQRGQSDRGLNFIFYNDQPPAGGPSMNEDRAHSKGVLLMDDISGHGLWLTHSTPRFPPQHLNELKFEKNAAINGQTFMCVTFDVAQMGDRVAKHLVTMRPQVYELELSEKLLNTVPQFKDLDNGGHSRHHGRRPSKGGEEQIHQTFETLAGQKLDLFSKSKRFDKDLYSDWLAPELQSDLFVETWRSGGGSPLNSSCPVHKHRVNNVKDLKIDLGSGRNSREKRANHNSTKKNDYEIDWLYTRDHSKWAISQEEDHSQVCIGDINRMQSQFHRGGGIVCMKNKKGWKLFRSTIKEIEEC